MKIKELLIRAEKAILRGVQAAARKIMSLHFHFSPKIGTFLKKNYKVIIAAVLTVYIIGGVVFGVRLYKQKRFDTIDRFVSTIYTFPVSNTGRAIQFDRELQYKMKWTKTFAEKTQSEIPADLMKRIIDDMDSDALILQEASRLGIRVTDADIDNIFAQSAEASLGSKEQAISFVSDKYGMSLAQFKQMMLPKIALDKIREQYFVRVKARHILIKDEARAADILKKIQDGGDFAQLAKDNSEDQSSKDNGGLLASGDFIFRDQGLEPDIENALFALNAGQTSGLVKSSLGNHIFRVEEKQGTINQTFDDWLAGLKVTYPVRVWVK